MYPKGDTKMDNKLHDLIEDQINKELWSAYFYYDIAEYYRSKNLDGFAARFKHQAHEEVEHADKFVNFLQDLEIPFVLKAVPGPEEKFKDFRDPLLFQVKHEAYVTSLIYGIYNRAYDVKDLGVQNFIQRYIAEQLEEEKTAKDLLAKFDLIAKDGGIAVYQFDKDLGGQRK